MGQYLRRRRAAGLGRAGLRSRPICSRRSITRRSGWSRPAEGFFTSLGFAGAAGDLLDPLADHPAARPRGDLPRLGLGHRQSSDDLRIKMCTKVNADDFVTVHHELGHNFYQRAYKQPALSSTRTAPMTASTRRSATSIALSVTPEYLVQIGLLDRSQGADAGARIPALLLRQAMDKVAFLPFGLLIDKWRWGVFSGHDHARRISGGAGSDCGCNIRASSRRVARGGARFRCRAPNIHIPAQHALHALFPRADPAVPVLQGGVRHAGWNGPAPPLLLLRQQGGRPAPERNAGDGRIAAVAGGARRRSPAAARCRPSR